MSQATRITAQLIMRRKDGRSILDLKGPVTAASPNRTAGDLPEDRIAEVRKRLEAAGFAVEGGNANTLSISGPRALFTEVFGLASDASGMAAQATRIREDLAPYVADVFVPPPPELFP